MVYDMKFMVLENYNQNNISVEFHLSANLSLCILFYKMY